MYLDDPGKRRLRWLAAGVVVVATLLPVALSLVLAREQARADQARRVAYYAADVLRRAEDTGRQVSAAFAELGELAPGSGCDGAARDLLRRIDASSSYIQMIGILDGDALACTSYGAQDAPIPLGPVEYTYSSGHQMRQAVELPFAPGMEFAVISYNGFAAVIHKSLPVDATIGEPGVALAVAMGQNGSLFASRGAIDPRWIPSDLAPGKRRSLRIGDHVVAQRRSQDYDFVAIAALGPYDYSGRLKRFAKVLVPIGLLIGIGLAWLALRMAKSQAGMAAGIRNALRDDQFFIVLQPIVELDSGRWIGAEVLLRWDLPDGRPVRPDLFIPVAEDNALITAITARVLDKVEPVLAEIVGRNIDIFLSINLSPQDLVAEVTLPRLQRLLERTGARSHQVHVEITERAFADTVAAREQVKRLRALGLCVSIDDFGTGYSSLSELVTFELDTLKIDKTFVDTLGSGAVTSHVAFHIVEMARSLKLGTVAEGIEHEHQADELRQWGVQHGQGWLYSKPLPIGAFLDRLAAAVVAPGAPPARG